MIADPNLIVDGWRMEAMALRKQLAAARAKSARQRKELRRLNVYMRGFWLGMASGMNSRDSMKLRAALGQKFGWPALHEAEREYLAQQQEQEK